MTRSTPSPVLLRQARGKLSGLVVPSAKTTDTEEKASYPLRNDGDTEPRIANFLVLLFLVPKLLTQKRKLHTRYAMTGTRNRGSQQNHRKTNLAKLRKTKLSKQKIKLLTRYAKTGTRNRGSQQNHRKTNLAKRSRKDMYLN